MANGWLQGNLLYLKPEHRGRGLAHRCFESALDLARSKGLHGFQFYSTLQRWGRESSLFSRELYIMQANGVPVYRYWRES